MNIDFVFNTLIFFVCDKVTILYVIKFAIVSCPVKKDNIYLKVITFVFSN